MVQLQGWVEGKITEPLFWKQSTIDPPELFTVPSKH